MSVEEVFDLTKIDRWFLIQIEEIVKIELELEKTNLNAISADEMRLLKKKGFSVALHMLPEGEKAKFEKELFKIYRTALKAGLDRHSAILERTCGIDTFIFQVDIVVEKVGEISGRNKW